MVTLSEVGRVDFGYFVRPSEESSTGKLRVEPCLGYTVRLDDGVLLLDSGMGAHPDVDARYRPVRRPLATALGDLGLHLADVRYLVNCHLHFDHCGGNPQLPGRPTFVLAGQAHDDASSFAADQLAWRAHREEQIDSPAPAAPPWIDRLMTFDPRRILFAHDRSVWEP